MHVLIKIYDVEVEAYRDYYYMRVGLYPVVLYAMLFCANFLIFTRAFQATSSKFRKLPLHSAKPHSLLYARAPTKASHFSSLALQNSVEVPVSVPVPVHVPVTMPKLQAKSINNTENEVSFVVYGEPMALARHRVLRSGISYNPSSGLQKQFLESCTSVLPTQPFEGPLEVRLVFYFKRPLNHYGTGKNRATLKQGMDIWHSKKKGKKFRPPF